MIVVSDASPIIALSLIQQLHLLQELYQEVQVPQAVFDEITHLGDEHEGVKEIIEAKWISVHSITNQTLKNALLGELDNGEAEAITLATELSAQLLLMDERQGRRTAVRMGLEVIGVLGILIEAKKKNLINSLAQQLDNLVEVAGFRISIELRQKVLEVAEELDS